MTHRFVNDTSGGWKDGISENLQHVVHKQNFTAKHK